MENCQNKGEKCWEKSSLILWLEKCVFCKHNAEPLKKASSISFENISIDSHGRMFLNGDEI